eukprot:6214491-Pleurochrysis_carterae.AAC.4
MQRAWLAALPATMQSSHCGASLRLLDGLTASDVQCVGSVSRAWRAASTSQQGASGASGEACSAEVSDTSFCLGQCADGSLYRRFARSFDEKVLSLTTDVTIIHFDI